jgi:hypothetical protein
MIGRSGQFAKRDGWLRSPRFPENKKGNPEKEKPRSKNKKDIPEKKRPSTPVNRFSRRVRLNLALAELSS